ncbi:MAG: hypothetical protein EZS28_012418 [Streblomastix strix]|uniref:Secreted protein n=1 Tax=Streblomastix strix TaxID=222440 RepID=A0A5J4WBW3_9EUKA|nr:MAG: hypothetical protein EZS28_012418 [Streblomastix strix]
MFEPLLLLYPTLFCLIAQIKAFQIDILSNMPKRAFLILTKVLKYQSIVEYVFCRTLDSLKQRFVTEFLPLSVL